MNRKNVAVTAVAFIAVVVIGAAAGCDGNNSLTATSSSPRTEPVVTTRTSTSPATATPTTELEWTIACGTAYNAGLWSPVATEDCDPTMSYYDFCTMAHDAGFGSSAGYPDNGEQFGNPRDVWIATCAFDLRDGITTGVGGGDLKTSVCQAPRRDDNPATCDPPTSA